MPIDPATALTLLSVGTSLLGAISGSKGQRKSGEAARQRADFQAAILRNNATLLRTLIPDVFARTAVTQRRIQLSTVQTVGSQRAALAAQGLLIDAGSARNIIADTFAVGQATEIDAQLNAERQALRLEIAAINSENDAKVTQLAGAQAEEASKIQARGTLLGGFAQTGGILSGINFNGLFTNPSTTTQLVGARPTGVLGPTGSRGGFFSLSR